MPSKVRLVRCRRPCRSKARRSIRRYILCCSRMRCMLKPPASLIWQRLPPNRPRTLVEVRVHQSVLQEHILLWQLLKSGPHHFYRFVRTKTEHIDIGHPAANQRQHAVHLNLSQERSQYQCCTHPPHLRQNHLSQTKRFFGHSICDHHRNTSTLLPARFCDRSSSRQ